MLPGGKAEELGWPPARYDRRQLAKGVRVEMEHTNDPRLAQEIAMDHLAEQVLAGHPQDYYDRLAAIEGVPYNPDDAKYLLLGVASLISGFAFAAAYGQAKKKKRIDFNPFQGDVLPVTPSGAAANTTAFCLAVYLATVGWRDTLLSSGYTKEEVATMIPLGFATAGVGSLILMAERTRKRDEGY